MDKEVLAVELPGDAATQEDEELKEDIVDAPATMEVDYATALVELENERIIRARAEADRDNYKKGLLKAKGKLPEEEAGYEQADIAALIEKQVNERFATIQSGLAQPLLETALNEISSKPEEQKLIRYHYENSIRQTGQSLDDIRRDLDNAKALANKSFILKKDKELKVALQNRSQVSNIGSGGSDAADVKRSFFSKEQIAGFTARAKELNMDPTKYIEDLKKNMTALKDR